MTQAPTPGPLSVGDRVVAVADLRKHPDGPVWVRRGEEVGIVREYGIDNCIAGVALQDGREGDWAKSCFRLAPTAPVESSGSERVVSDDLLIRGLNLMADHFKIENPLQRDFNVRGWPNMPASTSEAFSECAKVAAERLSALRPQPSGETREAVARLEHDLNTRNLYREEDGHFVLKVREDDLRALLSARPLALGGQHSTATDFPPDDVLACVDDTTPARAEAQDEGAAGERADTAFKIASDLHAAYEQLIYGLPKYLEAENLTDEENMIREAYITLDVTAHRLAAVSDAHPSPTPAADADRVRIAVEAFNAKINAPLTGPTHGAWDRGRIAGLKEALAALKSEAK